MSATLAPSETQSFAGGGSTAAQPTVFIGLGGAATAVLKILRRRLVERDSEDGLPRPSRSLVDGLGGPSSGEAAVAVRHNLRFLAIDTDGTSLQRAQEVEEGTALVPEEILHLPLRKPAEYRQASDEILSWLSRRWLYNIPRSLRTEGLRPLGRLAFVDHREAIADRLRRLLSGQPPRVFIVASIDGGAGGGMLLDVAYAVRQQLDQFKLGVDCYCGVMLHATLAHGPSNDLRKANAYATLTELNHFMRGGAAFHAGPVEVLPIGDVSEPPFRDAYLIHLGDELSPSEFDQSLARVADYLYLNVTCCGAALDHLRRKSRSTQADEASVRLRSFGLHAVRVEKRTIARDEADRLCLRLVQNWSGEDTDKSSARARIQPPAFGLDELNERVQSLAEQALGGNAEAHLRTLIISEAAIARAQDESAGRFGDVLRRIHAVLGTSTPKASQSGQSGRLETVLVSGTKQLAAAMGKALVDSIEALVDQTQARLPAALSGANLFQQHLRDLRQAADQMLDREQTQAQSVGVRLEQDRLPSERFWFSHFATTNAVIEECLLAYCRSLLRVMVYKQVICCLQEMMAMVAALNERLLALRQSLRWLAEEFAESSMPNAESAESAAREPALAGQLDRLTQTDCLTELEHGHLRPLLTKRGLLALADDRERWRELGPQLRETARTVVYAALAAVDAGSLLVERYPTAQALDAWLTAAVLKAAPPTSVATDNDRLFIVLPGGSSYEQLSAAAERCFPDSTTIVSEDCDLVLLRETDGIVLSDVAAKITESGETCTEAARRVLTRVDVDWSTLPNQPVP